MAYVRFCLGGTHSVGPATFPTSPHLEIPAFLDVGPPLSHFLPASYFLFSPSPQVNPISLPDLTPCFCTLTQRPGPVPAVYRQ